MLHLTFSTTRPFQKQDPVNLGAHVAPKHVHTICSALMVLSQMSRLDVMLPALLHHRITNVTFGTVS